MRKIIIAADTVSDLSQEYVEKNNILYMPLSYVLDDVEYDNIKIKYMPAEELYEKMRKGSMPKTSLLNSEYVKEVFIKEIEKGNDVFYIGCSSGISGTFNAACLAKEEIEDNKDKLISKKNQNFKIIALDSLSASLGYGMLVVKANELMQAGKTIEEMETLIKKAIPTACHYFTVSDLNHLARGGRISKTTAFVGSLLHIKPLLFVNKEGKLKKIGKERGRKKSIKRLADYMENKLNKIKTKEFYISHGDCMIDVEFLKKELTKRTGINKFVVNTVGPVVGSHSGPDTLALFFWGKDREEKET